MTQKHFTHEVFLTHAVSMDLLDYLCPVHKKEVLRVDAFRDLLNRTCRQPTGKMTKEGTPLVVEPGQLVTSVSELARAWDWHRDKVRDFVDALAERDVLTIDMHKKFMVLSFPDLAERIAEYAAKCGNQGDAASANSESSQNGTSEEMEQPTECSSGTKNVDTADDGIAAVTAEPGIQMDNEQEEGGVSATAKCGRYIQTDLFLGVDNVGTQQVPASSNQNRTE